MKISPNQRTVDSSFELCEYKSRPRLDISNFPLDKNNPSLSSLPTDFNYSVSVKSSKAWSFFRFQGKGLNNRFKSYILCIQFNFVADSRGLLRAFRQNGWLRGKGINLYNLDGSPLSIEEEKKNRSILVQRLKCLLSRDSIKNVVIFRYQITLMCYNLYGFKLPTDIRGWVFDTHHKKGITLITSGDRTLCSTLDYKDNLVSMSRSNHRAEHFNYGDTDFINFDSSDLALFKYYFYTYSYVLKQVV